MGDSSNAIGEGFWKGPASPSDQGAARTDAADGGEAPMTKVQMLAEIKTRLQAAHGARLKGVILYGSRARGDAQPDSDCDLLVLLDGPIKLLADIHKNVEALYDLVLATGELIHAHPVDVKEYEAQEFLLYRLAKREGLVA
jgi:predicted nucleotidyltransferase